jgi:hypothetical protein
MAMIKHGRKKKGLSAVPESVLGSELCPDGAAVRIDVYAMQSLFHQASHAESCIVE